MQTYAATATTAATAIDKPLLLTTMTIQRDATEAGAGQRYEEAAMESDELLPTPPGSRWVGSLTVALELGHRSDNRFQNRARTVFIIPRAQKYK